MRIALALIAPLAFGCGSTTSTDGGADAASDFAVADDLSTPSGDLAVPDFATPLPTGPDYAGCMDPFLNLTGNASANITFGQSHMYQPQCIIVQIGEPVNWMGDFANDPLEMASTNPSPVSPTVVSATLETVTFVKPGYYGYWSKEHGTDGGVGMAGLVRVIQ